MAKQKKDDLRQVQKRLNLKNIIDMADNFIDGIITSNQEVFSKFQEKDEKVRIAINIVSARLSSYFDGAFQEKKNLFTLSEEDIKSALYNGISKWKVA